MSKRLRLLLIVFVVLTSMATLLAACGNDDNKKTSETATPTAAPVEATPTVETATEMPTEMPTEVPTQAASGDTQRLILSTTTSTYDSGLLDYILPDFEQKYNVKVDVVSVGTGQALQLGANGDADVVLVHARAQEDQFVADGDGTQRYDVMYNDFVILGPASDPAGIKGMTSAADAFAKIAETKSSFVSRGDNSGTNTKETAIWAAANITPKGDWYISAGQGMGAVLTMSDELSAYTLSDRATYVARKAEGLALEILVEGDTILFNPYGVIPVNPEKHPNVNATLGQAFADWITSLDTQTLIASFEVNGQQLFTPDSEAWRAAHPSQ